MFISPCQCRGEGRGDGEGVEALINPCQCSGEGVGGMKKGGGMMEKEGGYDGKGRVDLMEKELKC